jgi:hypothetical protein
MVMFSRSRSRRRFGAVAICDYSGCESVGLSRSVLNGTMSGICVVKLAGLPDHERRITFRRPSDCRASGFADAQLRSSRKVHNFSSREAPLFLNEQLLRSDRNVALTFCTVVDGPVRIDTSPQQWMSSCRAPPVARRPVRLRFGHSLGGFRPSPLS